MELGIQAMEDPQKALLGLGAGAVVLYLMMSVSKPVVFGKLCAAVNLYLVLHTSLAVNLLLLFSFLFIRPWSGYLARKWNSEVAQALWSQCMSVIFPWTHLVVTGDLPDEDTQAIIISNHQLDCDWWILWELLRTLKREGDLKVILKDNYKNIPVIGWGIKGFQFIMLARNWAKDSAGLQRQLAVFRRDHFPLRLLIFPEGTTANTRDMAKSEKFAAAHNKPIYKLLVVPRTTGFLACCEALVNTASSSSSSSSAASSSSSAAASTATSTSSSSSNSGSAGASGGGGNGKAKASGGNGNGSGFNGNGSVGNGRNGRPHRYAEQEPLVYDVTMAYEGYSGEIPTWELGYDRLVDTKLPSLGKLLAGQRARPVHLHIARFRARDAAAAGEKWIVDRWAEKEKLLEAFIRDGRFPPISNDGANNPPTKPIEVKARPAVAAFLFGLALPVLTVQGVCFAWAKALAALQQA